MLSYVVWCLESSRSHEINELFDAAKELRFKIGIRIDSFENILPSTGDVGLVLVRPAKRCADALLPFD